MALQLRRKSGSLSIIKERQCMCSAPCLKAKLRQTAPGEHWEIIRQTYYGDMVYDIYEQNENKPHFL